jgi:prophage regulatory protein
MLTENSRSPSRTLIVERLPEVRARTGLSRSEIYRRIRNRTFPAPIKIGARATGWSASEVDAWITARIAERNAKAVA